LYHEMHTGKWWWNSQVCILCLFAKLSCGRLTLFIETPHREHPGVTIIPVIISSDKTQVTLFCNKTAYPVYMTIGNIPKEIC
jgi:hypothetical protein